MTTVWDQPVQQYENTSLILYLYHIPRKDLGYNDVEEGFRPDEQEYLEGVGTAAIPFATMALLTLLVFLIRCTFRSCRGCLRSCNVLQGPEEKKRDPPVIRMWIFRFIAVFIICGVIYGFVANSQVRAGVNDVRAALADMDSMRVENIVAARAVSADLSDISGASTRAISSLQALEQQLAGYIDVNTAVSAATEIVNQMDNAVDFIDTGAAQFEDVDIQGEADGYIKRGESYRYNAQIGILAFLLLPYVIVILSQLCKLQRILWNIAWISVMCAMFGWLLSAGESSMCLFLGDMCYDPSDYLLQLAEDSGDETLQQYARFYIICENIPNPLDGELRTATTTVDSVQDELLTLSDLATNITDFLGTEDTNAVALSNDVDIIVTSTQQVTASVNNLLDTIFLCNRVHNNYVQAMEGICHKALRGFCILVVVQVLMAFLTWVAIYCGVVLYRYLRSRRFDDGEAKEGQVDQDENWAMLVKSTSNFGLDRRNFSRDNLRRSNKAQEMANIEEDHGDHLDGDEENNNNRASGDGEKRKKRKKRKSKRNSGGEGGEDDGAPLAQAAVLDAGAGVDDHGAKGDDYGGGKGNDYGGGNDDDKGNDYGGGNDDGNTGANDDGVVQL